MTDVTGRPLLNVVTDDPVRTTDLPQHIRGAGHGRDALDDFVSALARASGAWIIIERRGTILSHAPGGQACPTPLARSVLERSAGPLRRAVKWQDCAAGVGTVDNHPVHAEQLTPVVTAWAIGVSERPPLAYLREVLPEEEPAVHDPVVARLLAPAEMSGTAPPARLVVIDTHEPARLSRRLCPVLEGTGSRVHTADGRVVVALELGVDPMRVLVAADAAELAAAGVATVASGARDWSTAYRLATEACDLARRTHRLLCDASSADVAASLVLAAAARSATLVATDLAYPPVTRLREYDARHGSDLLQSLVVWCRNGFDTAATASALRVHQNTLRYRLRRAEVVAGADLSCRHQRLALQVVTHEGQMPGAAGAPSRLCGNG